MPWPSWTEQQVVAALAAYHDRHGRWPTRRDWQAQRGVPSYSFVVRHWGWRGALQLAGGDSPAATHCPRGHERDGEGRCRRCAVLRCQRWRVRRALRRDRADDRLRAYAADDVLPTTVAHLQRLGPEQLADVRRAVDDELTEAARHIARLVALRDHAQRREAELAERAAAPTPERRMAIAAAAATPTGRGHRARGG